MLTPSKIHEFLLNNTLTEENSEMVLNHLRVMAAEQWSQGWMDCEAARKKRQMLSSSRRSKFLKTFFDYLSDLTHGK